MERGAGDRLATPACILIFLLFGFAILRQLICALFSRRPIRRRMRIKE